MVVRMGKNDFITEVIKLVAKRTKTKLDIYSLLCVLISVSLVFSIFLCVLNASKIPMLICQIIISITFIISIIISAYRIKDLMQEYSNYMKLLNEV